MTQQEQLRPAIVTMFNTLKGLGFATLENGEKLFIHETAIKGSPSTLRTLVPGEKIMCGDFAKGREGYQANTVVPPAERPLLEVRKPRPDPILLDNRAMVCLRVDALGRIYGLNDKDALAPHVKTTTNSFRAFCAGFMAQKDIKGFDFVLPQSTEERAIVLLHGKTKAPQEVRRDGHYSNFMLGSYIAIVEASGRVVVFCLGRRFQKVNEWRGEHWVIVERRYEHVYQNILSLGLKEIQEQTPISGLRRDNDGFIPGILLGIKWLRENSIIRDAARGQIGAEFVRGIVNSPSK